MRRQLYRLEMLACFILANQAHKGWIVLAWFILAFIAAIQSFLAGREE